jgi:hypothetical protein
VIQLPSLEARVNLLGHPPGELALIY